MKIIDIAICIDNEDPKGLGRIRCVRFSDYVGAKERALEYQPFSREDPFIAIPFLPLNINLIPEKGQAIKIISHDSEKNIINQEYITGPFSTPFDFNGQSFTNQLEETSYGNINLDSPKIIEPDGQYVNKKTDGSLAKKTDYGVYGKYGSDIIFTNGGINIRGGKLISKEITKDRKKLLNFPIMSSKSATLNLKKFPEKMSLLEKEKVVIEQEIKDIKTLLEYEITDNDNNINLTSPTKIKIYIYNILKKHPNLTKTNNFSNNTELPEGYLKLINENNNNTTPTIIIDITDNDLIKKHIKNIIYSLLENNIKELTKNNPLIKIDNSFNEFNNFPMYFRPTKKLSTYKTSNNNESILLNNIYNYLLFYKKFGPKNGLFWSKNNLSVPTTQRKSKEKTIKRVDQEQSFSLLKSDKIFLVSTDTNETDKKIDLEKLNKYEPTQEEYVSVIDPNTYSLVRGEILLKFINKILDVLYNHEHNLIGPMVKNEQFDDLVELENIRKTIENDLLNKSIKLN